MMYSEYKCLLSFGPRIKEEYRIRKSKKICSFIWAKYYSFYFTCEWNKKEHMQTFNFFIRMKLVAFVSWNKYKYTI